MVMGVRGTNNTIQGFGKAIRPSTLRAMATETTTKQANDSKQAYQHARNGGEQHREGSGSIRRGRVPGPVQPSRPPSPARARERGSHTPDAAMEAHQAVVGIAACRRIALKIKHLYN